VSVLRTDVSSLGQVVGSSGVVTVDGMQWIGSGNMRVGDAGVGSLFIRNGADVTQASITIGNLPGSGGTATLDANGSTWNTAGDLIVGRQGGGFISIQTGSDVTSGNGTLGSMAGSTGTVFVNANGSSWSNTSSLTVGGAGDGTMLVQTGGDVTSVNGFVARLAGGEGTASVSGAGSTWNLSGRMSVGGDAVTGVAGGAGTLDVMASGAVTVASDVTLFPMGQVRLAGGTLSAGEIRFQGAGGQFNWTSGTLQLGAYRGSLVNSAGLLESRGLISTITIDNNYTQQAGGTLRVGIGGPTPNTSYDVVNVGGTAALDGLLEIQQAAGYVPTPNLTFTVLDAAAITGTFDNVANGQRLQITGGVTSGSFVVNYGAGSPFDPTRIVLTSFQITGDYNLDGSVNAADYTLWRDTLGSTTDLRANGNNSGASAGVIDTADFDAWKTNFGKKATGLGAGSLNAVAVPEPGAASFALLAFFLLACRRNTADVAGRR
jgi:fibronectin-binding autotransporter adhesin